MLDGQVERNQHARLKKEQSTEEMEFSWLIYLIGPKTGGMLKEKPQQEKGSNESILLFSYSRFSLTLGKGEETSEKKQNNNKTNKTTKTTGC